MVLAANTMIYENLYVVTVGRKIEYDYIRPNGKKKTYKDVIHEYEDFTRYKDAAEYKNMIKNLPGIQYIHIDQVQNI